MQSNIQTMAEERSPALRRAAEVAGPAKRERIQGSMSSPDPRANAAAGLECTRHLPLPTRVCLLESAFRHARRFIRAQLVLPQPYVQLLAREAEPAGGLRF